MKKVLSQLVRNWPVTVTAILASLQGMFAGGLWENRYHWFPIAAVEAEQSVLPMEVPYHQHLTDELAGGFDAFDEQLDRELLSAESEAQVQTVIVLPGDWRWLAPVVEFCNDCYSDPPKVPQRPTERYAAIPRPGTI